MRQEKIQMGARRDHGRCLFLAVFRSREDSMACHFDFTSLFFHAFSIESRSFRLLRRGSEAL